MRRHLQSLLDLGPAGAGSPGPAKPLAAAVAEFTAAKAAAGRSPHYVKQLRWYLGKFAAAVGGNVADVGDAAIERWFAGRQEKLSARKTSHGHLSAFFAFAVRHGWRADNPAACFESLTIPRLPPEILTPEQCAALLRHAPESLRPFLALALWCGLRPSEARAITRGDVDLARGVVTVRVSKVRRWRMVPLPATAAAILGEVADWPAERRLCLPEFKGWRALRALQRASGVKIGQDQLRHTAASYYLAKYQDAGKVAHWLGNSPAVLLGHYYNLVPTTAAEAFFGISGCK